MKSLLTKIISVLTIFCIFASLCGCTNKTSEPNCNGNHTWKLTSTTSTCFDGGVESYECEVCKTTKTENVSAYGHDLVQSSYNAPTCKTNGEKVEKCSRCGFESKQTLLTIECDYQVKSTTPSTCTVKGSQLLECSMCHEIKMEALELKSHEYELKNTTDSTCIVHGYKYYHCKDCTANYNEQLPFANHTYETTTKQATCFTRGGTVEKCSVCEDEKPISETPLLTHDFGADGYCTKCGVYKTLFDVDKLNGTYSYGTSLGMVKADLIPKFNNTNSVDDSYWESHIVTLKISLYDKNSELIGEKEIVSRTDANGKLTIQSAQKVEFRNDRSNQISVRLQADEVFYFEILQATASYKFEISCDGYETIEKAYIVTEAQ